MKRARVSTSIVFLSSVFLGGAVGLAGGRAVAEITPPRNVGAEPGSAQSSALASLAASAQMRGNPRQALVLADQALAADARNPWATYDKATALSRLGMTDEAVQSFRVAEQQFSPGDRWARSVAIYGRAHALEEARRCPEAKAAFAEYVAFVEKDDPTSAAMARRYASECNPPAAATPPGPAAAPPAPGAVVVPPPPVAPPAASLAPVTPAAPPAGAASGAAVAPPAAAATPPATTPPAPMELPPIAAPPVLQVGQPTLTP